MLLNRVTRALLPLVGIGAAGLAWWAASTFVPKGMSGYESPESAIHVDVAQARALLAEAGASQREEAGDELVAG